MCGRYNLNTNPRSLQDHFGPLITDTETHSGGIPGSMLERFNIAPSQSAPVIRMRKGEYSNDLMVWGFRPSWAKRGWINARVETVFTSGAFKRSAKSKRCLVPATGWYEWKGSTTPRQPYHLHFQDNRPFAFAGIWTARKTDQGWELSYAILTTEALGIVAGVHDRMPLVVHTLGTIKNGSPPTSPVRRESSDPSTTGSSPVLPFRPTSTSRRTMDQGA